MLERVARSKEGREVDSWSHRLGRTSARPPRLPHQADCFTSLHLLFLQLGMEAAPAHSLREDVTASLCASAVVFVSWKSCGEAEGGRGRGTGRGWPAGPIRMAEPCPPPIRAGNMVLASRRFPSPAVVAGSHVVLE